MRLATFSVDEVITYGVEVDGGVIDIRDLDPAEPGNLAATLLDLVKAGDEGLAALATAIANHSGPPRSRDSIAFLAPLPRPGKIVCLALNNSANATRIISGPSHSALFSKPSTALIGHGTQIPLRPEYGRVHPEPELAVIIGKTGRDIAASDAFEHVFGYTVHNDLTSPTMREEDTYNYRAIHPEETTGGIRYVETQVSYPGRYKGSDGFAPMGPWIVTKDAIPDPHDLAISCWHGDILVTSDNTANLTHHLPEVIAWISRFMTLEAGDIVSLGTALSAAADTGKAIQTIDLNMSDTEITIKIDGVGTLTNPVAR